MRRLFNGGEASLDLRAMVQFLCSPHYHASPWVRVEVEVCWRQVQFDFMLLELFHGPFCPGGGRGLSRGLASTLVLRSRVGRES